MVPLNLAGRYKVLDLIGRGGMGNVHRGLDRQTGEPCALKLLRADLAEDPECVERLLREARAASRVRHPGIVRIFDAGVEGDFPFIAMELLEGESLAARLTREGRLAPPAALRVVKQLLEALSALHVADIVHRDIKPANVYLVAAAPPGEEVRLLDFGIAKALTESHSRLLTRTGQLLGTPDYLAPEQIRGDVTIDARADLFSTGSLLYELLVGRPPFRTESAVATTYRVVHWAPQRLADAGVKASGLQWVLDRALAKGREQRFQTAGEFAAALRELEGDIDRVGLAASAPTSPAGSATEPEPEGTFRAVGVAFARVPSARMGVLRALDKALLVRRGRLAQGSARARAAEARRLLEEPATQSAPLGVVAAYVEAMDATALEGDLELWRAFGRAAVELELLPVVRSVLSAASLAGACVRGVDAWASLWSFGEWRCDPGVPSLTVRGFDALPPPMLAWLSGLVEETLHLAVGHAVHLDAATIDGELTLRPRASV